MANKEQFLHPAIIKYLMFHAGYFGELRGEKRAAFISVLEGHDPKIVEAATVALESAIASGNVNERFFGLMTLRRYLGRATCEAKPAEKKDCRYCDSSGVFDQLGSFDKGGQWFAWTVAPDFAGFNVQSMNCVCDQYASPALRFVQREDLTAWAELIEPFLYYEHPAGGGGVIKTRMEFRARDCAEMVLMLEAGLRGEYFDVLARRIKSNGDYWRNRIAAYMRDRKNADATATTNGGTGR